MARRQAFSTSTITKDATESFSSYTPVLSSTWSTRTPAPIPDDSSQFHVLQDSLTQSESYCTVALPSGGIISFNDSYAITLDDSLSFATPYANDSIFCANSSTSGNSTVIKSDIPFYASNLPQVYALATATILSYLLVVILFITPRTFYVGGPSGSNTYSGGVASGLLGRGTNSSVIGVGRRPLLQKIAAITVAVSLTIATADTFTVAHRQYHQGYMNSRELVNLVVGSTEIRVTRVISDAFLWLAQVQTLIRLFPRHKEKVTIKWLGFGLVLCDTVFSILENFTTEDRRARPETFTDAIPALSYLFEMAISLIYASCVIYYSLSQRRFAFWSPKMKSMCIMALLSLSAVLVPVVFFIVDVVQPDIATWGEYIRWVGAAAASVVVWEWVERIEALERDERKDGILGREVFDGDEMLEETPSEDVNYGGGVRFGARRGTEDHSTKRPMWKDIRDLNLRSRLPQMKLTRHAGRWKEKMAVNNNNAMVDDTTTDGIARPVPIATPISRADTTSASTIYAVRYHNPLSPSPIIPEEPTTTQPPGAEGLKENSDESTLTNNTTHDGQSSSKRTSHAESGNGVSSGHQVWQSVSNPFKRKRAEPPAEVAAQIASSNMRRSPGIRSIRTRLNIFNSSSKARVPGRNEATTISPQVTVIPAQPRGSRRGSRVEQHADTNLEHSINLGAPQGMNADIPEVDEETNSQASLPVTVIPPPVRGGRTWSPDDLYDPPAASTNAASRSQQSRTSSAVEPTRPILPTRRSANSSPSVQTHANRSNVSVMQTQGTPGRSSNSPASHAQLRSSGRDRNATMTSISDRLSTSPIATPGTSTTPASTSRAAVVSDPASRPTESTSPKESIVPTSTASRILDEPTLHSVSHPQPGSGSSPGSARVTFTQPNDKSVSSDSRIEPKPP